LSPLPASPSPHTAQTNKEERITVDEALQHPWVVPGGAPDKNLHNSFKESIQSLAQVCALDAWPKVLPSSMGRSTVCAAWR
jgi:hypothetical protein